jgi:hypothetical protein
MIDSTTFNRVRRRVMKRLAPDWVAQKSTYSRETPELQVHCIEFAPGKWGGEFSVDLGMHFTYVPSFEAFAYMPVVRHPQPDTCCLHRRWRNDDNGQLFPYGESAEEAEQFAAFVVNDCLDAFGQINDQWKNGRPLLDKLPPKTMKSDAVIFKQLMDCPDLEERDRISETMAIRQLFPGWFPHVAPMCIMLAHIAARFGATNIISEYLAITQSPGQGHIMSPRAEWLVDSLVAATQNAV